MKGVRRITFIKKYVKVIICIVAFSICFTSIVLAQKAGVFEKIMNIKSSNNNLSAENTKQYTHPSVYGMFENNQLVIKWNSIEDNRLKGYKIVASKANETPSYPRDGYLYYITDKTATKAVIDRKTVYNGGDFGGSFISGDIYYFSVTALYENDVTIAGNAIALKYPEGANTVFTSSQIYGSLNGDKLILNWTKANDNNSFNAYYVVASQSNIQPSYEKDGYIIKINDINKTSAVIDYKKNFKNKLTAGQTYYFSVTASYNNTLIPGNSIKISLSDVNKPTDVITPIPTKNEETKPNIIAKPTNTPTPEPSIHVQYPVPKVKASIDEAKIKISWDKIAVSNFIGYKVVASKNNSHPAYPANGYFYWITDRNTTYCYVDIKTHYNNNDGDVGSNLVAGEQYYFSVTAIYDDDWKKVAGNSVRLTVPAAQDPVPTIKAADIITAKVENDTFSVSWSKAGSDGFVYYKIVISELNDHPKYPDDGYYTYIQDVDTLSWSTSITKQYNGGDFGGYLQSGHSYYASITAVYDSIKVSGNVVKITVP